MYGMVGFLILLMDFGFPFKKNILLWETNISGVLSEKSMWSWINIEKTG